MSRPFIPIWLDREDLTPVQFRVLAHLWMRADKSGVCWPSGPSIAKACKINRDSVWPAIALLESRGLLSREKAFRNSNRYVLRVGGNEGPTQPDESAEKEGLQPAESEGLHPAESKGCQSAEKEGRKCITKKATHRRDANEGKRKRVDVSDEEWIASLKSDPVYQGIDIDSELEKAGRWIAGKPGRKLTRRFFTNWLGRADKPLAIQQRETRTLNLGKRGHHNPYDEQIDLPQL